MSHQTFQRLVGAARRRLLPSDETWQGWVEAGRRRVWPTSDTWHSWDPHPWKHPWLEKENLQAVRSFSEQIWDSLGSHADKFGAGDGQYAFVGNLANNLYMRAVPLRRRGLRVAIVLHPQDHSVMSQPAWEEFEETLPSGNQLPLSAWLDQATVPTVEDVYQFDEVASEAWGARDSITQWRSLKRLHPYLQFKDVQRWPERITLPTLDFLQSFDALIAAQAPAMAYLSNRPYAAVSVGGDAWFECSRNDSLGAIQRTAYARSRVVLAHQPWTFAHARRFGWANVIYFPLMMDEDTYKPGQRVARAEWERQVGGSFFVLMTARLDDVYKGTHTGLEGFAEACRSEPGLRLVLMDWGTDRDAHIAELKKRGLADRILILPRAGKRRVISYLQSADCLIDQFVTGYYGATALEAMACGVPVIMRVQAAQYDALCNTGAPPVLEANAPAEIATHLVDLSRDRNRLEACGRQHRHWFEENHSSKAWGSVYVALLRALASGWKHRFDRSPLRRPQSSEEAGYLEACARMAPPFPSYSI